MKIGYKVNGLWASQYHPIGTQLPVSVIVNNMPLARQIANTGKMVIHRFESLGGTKDEGYSAWHRSIGAEQYAQLLASAHGESNKDIWIYLLNEPNVGNINDQREMLRFVEVAGRWLVQRDFKVVVVNTPPASWRGDWIEAGASDALLSWASQNRNSVIIGYHEYTEFHLVQFGAGERNYERFGDPTYVSKSNWASSINPDNSWHIGHVTRLIRRARQLGLKPRFGCTEINYGDVQDPPNMNAKISLARQFPPSPLSWSLNGITLHNGQHTLHGYWRAMFPQWTWEQVVIEQLKWYSNIMGNLWGAEFATLYAFGFGGEHGQDYWNDQAFHNMLIQWQNTTTTPPIVGRDMYIRSAGSWNVNVRSAPNTSSPIMGTIGQANIPITYYETVNGWHKILWNNKTAYVSAQHTVLVPRQMPEWVNVHTSYRYDKNDTKQVDIHNQIQDLLKLLS